LPWWNESSGPGQQSRKLKLTESHAVASSPVALPYVALVSARAARASDEDLPPLERALEQAGARVTVAEWDDPSVEWGRFDLALLRSTWDYALRANEFCAWAERVAAETRLLNPLRVVLWNIDKHYLGRLKSAGVPVVPTEFIEPGEDNEASIDAFLATHAASEFVVKPAVGSGSRDAQRHSRSDLEALRAHIRRLVEAGRGALLQPYLHRVNEYGETALVFFAGRFSHAVRKGPLLRAGAGPIEALFAPEEITTRVPTAEELSVAERALAAGPLPNLLYARVDLLRDAAGRSCVLEFELTEPSLFLNHAEGAAERFAREILRACEAFAIGR
jgi:glutathione synthase/RimK-type ligase-like ATP-grasp enzyme